MNSGTCTLTANWAADANHLAAGPLTQSTLTTKIAPTVTFTGAHGTAIYNTTFTVGHNHQLDPVWRSSRRAELCSIAGNVVTMSYNGWMG